LQGRTRDRNGVYNIRRHHLQQNCKSKIHKGITPFFRNILTKRKGHVAATRQVMTIIYQFRQNVNVFRTKERLIAQLPMR